MERGRRPNRRYWWGLAILVVLGAPMAWYLGSPLFIDRTVIEEFPMSAKATLPPGIPQPQAEQEMAAAAKVEQAMSEPMPQPAPRPLASGTFVGADSFHRGSGTALIAAIGGQHLLRLQEFRVTNGPDLYVYLAVHPNPASRADVDEGFVSLGRLKGNIGAQNYSLPPGTDQNRFRAVVIYCRRFHVVFATATLERSE